MAINMRCPRCGSAWVQLSNETSKHGCLYLILFGVWYFVWLMVRWMVGLLIFVMYDWWMAAVHAVLGKGHVWQSKRWLSNRRRIYYCHHCGLNFRA